MLRKTSVLAFLFAATLFAAYLGPAQADYILCESPCFLYQEGWESICDEPRTGRSFCTCRHGVWACGI